SVITKHAGCPGSMFTGTLSAPITALVAQSVALYVSAAGIGVARPMPVWEAGLAPALRMVANTVADVFASTARLDGKIAATRTVGGGGAAKASPLETWSRTPSWLTTPVGVTMKKLPSRSAPTKNAWE